MHEKIGFGEASEILANEAQEAGRLVADGEREDGAILWTLKDAVAPSVNEILGVDAGWIERTTRQAALQMATQHAQAVFGEYDVEHGTKASFVITYARAFAKFLAEG